MGRSRAVDHYDRAVRAYFSIINAPPTDDAVRLRVLGAAPDQLSFAYGGTTEAQSVDGDDPPEGTDYKAMCEKLRRAFPKFGFYAVVTPVPDPNVEVMVGDAIDDLADIASELEPVLWLWDQGRRDEAAWRFHFGYRSHWGSHLHDLRRYVHKCYLDSGGY